MRDVGCKLLQLSIVLLASELAQADWSAPHGSNQTSGTALNNPINATGDATGNCCPPRAESGRMGRCDFMAQKSGCAHARTRNLCPVACGSCAICDPALREIYRQFYVRTARMRAKAAPSEVAFTNNYTVSMAEARNMALKMGKDLSRRSRLLLVDVVIRGLSFSHYVNDPGFDLVPTMPIFDYAQFSRTRTTKLLWPRYGHSLVGVDGMSQVAKLLEIVLERGVPGHFVEAGAWKGANGILARKLFDASPQSEDQDRMVYSLDSFSWFPKTANKSYYADRGLIETFHFNTTMKWHDNFYADISKVKQIHSQFGIDVGLESSRVRLVQGFFQQTAPQLASFLQSTGERISVLVIDANSYQGTWESLMTLYAHVSIGGYVFIGDYGSFPSRRATDDFRGCIGIDSELNFFLPHSSRHGREGQAYWRKYEETPSNKRLHARCDPMPSLNVGFGANQEDFFLVARVTTFKGKRFSPVMKMPPLNESGRPETSESLARFMYRPAAMSMFRAAASAWSAASKSTCFVDVLLYGLIRSDAMLEYTTPTLRSHVLAPMQGYGCLHVHAYCLESQCNISTTHRLLRELNAVTVNVTQSVPPAEELGKHVGTEWNARDLNGEDSRIARMIAKDSRKRREKIIDRWRSGVHSLWLAWTAARHHTPAKYDESPSGLVVVCRIDVAFVAKPLYNLWASNAWEEHEQRTAFVPRFQHYGALNDRFMYGSAMVMKTLVMARKEQAGLGETFAERAMCAAVLEHNVSVRTTDVKFVRVREDLFIPKVDNATVLQDGASTGVTRAQWWHGHTVGMCLSCIASNGRCRGSEEVASNGLNPYHSFCPGNMCQLLTSFDARLGAFIDRAQLAGLITLARSRPAVFAAFHRRITKGTSRLESVSRPSRSSRKGNTKSVNTKQPSKAEINDAKKAKEELDALTRSDLLVITEAEKRMAHFRELHKEKRRDRRRRRSNAARKHYNHNHSSVNQRGSSIPMR